MRQKRQESRLHTVMDVLRVPQYAKNLLLFVPLVTSHSFEPTAFMKLVAAFILFSLCASAGYILNDLIDTDADRAHPVKRNRPFACGRLTPEAGLWLIVLLLLLAFGGAALLSSPFAGMLLIYFLSTVAYSVYFKRKVMVDIVFLAMLYTLRVIAGAVVLPVMPSEWLLAFSVFIFTCLALVKRYAELALRSDENLPDPVNRDYYKTDMTIVMALAAASGLNGVTIFALYIHSEIVKALYRDPNYLWLMCPILLYWIGRVLLLAHRRKMGDDPIQFALYDKASYLVCALMLGVVFLAM